ncbi:bacterioferritin-associated ferredoxin [Lysobacter enzymogenes]
MVLQPAGCQPKTSAVYVCICNGVTDRDIRQAAEAGCRSVSELTMRTGAGANCGSCLDLAGSLLEQARNVRDLPLSVLQQAA